MINQFEQKLNKLSPEIQDILLSDFGRSLEVNIFKKYKLPQNKAYLVGEIVSLIYFNDLKLEDLVNFIAKNFDVDENKSKLMALDLVGMRVLVAKDYLRGQNVEKFIENLGGDIKKYEQYVVATKEAIAKEKNGTEDELPIGEIKSDFQKRETDIKKEREDSLDVFKNNLVELLKYPENPYLTEYNLILFQVLAEDSNFKKELENTLYSNQEVVTESDFSIDGQKSAPTVSGWLKDFIKKNGSGIFDNVVLSKYLTQSENGRKLNQEERKLVGNLLELYRNLKFFPDSMPSDDGEGWAILPVENNSSQPIKARTVSGPPKTEKEKTVEELEKMAVEYPLGSLERRVVEEEIRKAKK